MLSCYRRSLRLDGAVAIMTDRSTSSRKEKKEEIIDHANGS